MCGKRGGVSLCRGGRGERRLAVRAAGRRCAQDGRGEGARRRRRCRSGNEKFCAAKKFRNEKFRAQNEIREKKFARKNFVHKLKFLRGPGDLTGNPAQKFCAQKGKKFVLKGEKVWCTMGPLRSSPWGWRPICALACMSGTRARVEWAARTHSIEQSRDSHTTPQAVADTTFNQMLGMYKGPERVPWRSRGLVRRGIKTHKKTQSSIALSQQEILPQILRCCTHFRNCERDSDSSSSSGSCWTPIAVEQSLHQLEPDSYAAPSTCLYTTFEKTDSESLPKNQEWQDTNHNLIKPAAHSRYLQIL